MKDIKQKVLEAIEKKKSDMKYWDWSLKKYTEPLMNELLLAIKNIFEDDRQEVSRSTHDVRGEEGGVKNDTKRTKD